MEGEVERDSKLDVFLEKVCRTDSLVGEQGLSASSAVDIKNLLKKS